MPSGSNFTFCGRRWAAPKNALPLPLPKMNVSAVACNVAIPMARYRVYCVILRWPTAPSCCNFSSFGMTTPRTCMMMLAVMYGMMPSAKMLNEPNAPPENMSRKPSAPCDCTPSLNWATASRSMPGTRTALPARYSNTIANMNRILFRRSGTRKTFFRLENTGWLPAGVEVGLG